MIGIEITSKETGIPLFTYEFQPNTLFDSEIRGGLITAIMQVMGETFGVGEKKTKNVNYGNYHAILTEGSHIYGILFTFQTGPTFEQFITDLVQKFEAKFESELNKIAEPDSVIEIDDFDFSEECSEAYGSLIHIDASKLSKLLDLISNYEDKIFQNMLIYSRPEMSQIYTHLSSEKFSVFSDEVSNAIKTLLELSVRTSFPIEGFEIALSQHFYCVMFNIFPYALIMFVDKTDLETTHSRMKEIITAFG
ncbi:MAG: hypothetical protein ACW964_09770 [Candidatus Hodarchaeales archaeon]|jgi:hypothetical protein